MSRCSYILRRLENWGNKSAVILDSLTIEHIIPQNPHLPVSWVSTLGSGWEGIQKKYLHTIGNLTLTAYNPEMSDSAFFEKMTMDGGFQQSALRLNKYVVTQSTWGELQVNERAAQLGEIAKKVWLYPTLTDAELAPYRNQDVLAPEYAIESYQYLNAYNRILFEKLNARILNLSKYVKREFKKMYIAYKADTNFVDVVIQSSRLRLTINMKFADVIDPKGICKDITNSGRWGNGDVEVGLDSLDELEDAMMIIEQAFRLRDVE